MMLRLIHARLIHQFATKNGCKRFLGLANGASLNLVSAPSQTMVRSIHLSRIVMQDSVKDQRVDSPLLSTTAEVNESRAEVIKEGQGVVEKKAKRKIPQANKMPPRPKLPESDISEKFIKGGSGKGGQKINKTNSKVQLTHIPTGLVVTSQATRSREQNRKIARQILALKIQEMELGENSRARIVIERKRVLKQRNKKKTKAKYKKLDEAKMLAKEDSAHLVSEDDQLENNSAEEEGAEVDQRP